MGQSLGVVFPIPDGRALEAAKDLAADVRNTYGPELLKLHEAIERGEGNEQTRKDYELLRSQIQGLAETHFYCQLTGVTYRVGDYVTARSKFLAGIRLALIADAYEKIKRVFH